MADLLKQKNYFISCNYMLHIICGFIQTAQDDKFNRVYLCINYLGKKNIDADFLSYFFLIKAYK